MSATEASDMTLEQLVAMAKGELREDFAVLSHPDGDLNPRLYAWSPAGLIARPIPRAMFASTEREHYLFRRAIPLLVALVGLRLVAFSSAVYRREPPIPFEQMTAGERETILRNELPSGWRPTREWPSTECLLLVALDGAREQSWFAQIHRRASRKPTLGAWETYGPGAELRGMTEHISAALR